MLLSENTRTVQKEVVSIVRAKSIHRATEKALTLKKLLKEHAAYCDCQAAGKTVGFPVTCYCHDGIGILIKTDRIDGALQKAVPVTLYSDMLYLSHYPTVAGNPRKRPMCNTMRENDLLTTHCEWCVHSCMQMSLMNLERIWSDAQEGTQALPTCWTPQIRSR